MLSSTITFGEITRWFCHNCVIEHQTWLQWFLVGSWDTLTIQPQLFDRFFQRMSKALICWLYIECSFFLAKALSPKSHLFFANKKTCNQGVNFSWPQSMLFKNFYQHWSLHSLDIRKICGSTLPYSIYFWWEIKMVNFGIF